MASTFQRDIAVSEVARLNSDQVNYLIWRYLQEGGFGEAAVKLQRDWKLDPQSLPLAKHIKGGALVRLIKRGLHSYYVEKTWDKRTGKRTPLQQSMLYFGPESARPVPQPELDAEGETEDGGENHVSSPKSSSARKHARESGPSSSGADHAVQPAAKRSRRTPATTTSHDRHSEDQRQQQQLPQQQQQQQQDQDQPPQQPPQPQQQLQQPPEPDAMNYETSDNVNVVAETDAPEDMANSASPESGRPVPEARSPSPAELDQDTEMVTGGTNGVVQDLEPSNGAFPGAAIDTYEPHFSEQDRISEPPAPVPTLDSGHSVGVQFAPAKVSAASEIVVPESYILQVADNSHVIDLSWRPTDATVLAAAGQDFAGLWNLSGQHITHTGAIQPAFHEYVDRGSGSMVSALAWEPGGTSLAVAVYDEQSSGGVRIYDGDDAFLTESMPTAQRLITALRWQSLGSRLIGLETGVAGPADSALLLWQLAGSSPLGESTSFALPIPEQIHDVNWASHGDTSSFCAAGVNVVYQGRAISELVIEKRWSSAAEHPTVWTMVKCSWWSEEVDMVIAASAHPPSIWIPAKNVYAKDVHSALLTCLELRPGQILHPFQDPYCDFATASIDGSIKMWRYNHQMATIDCLFKMNMFDHSPILALQYSPDSKTIAAASYDQVTLWNSEHRSAPLAKWVGEERVWNGSYLKQRRRASLGETMSEDGGRDDIDHSLTWDAESTRLGFALGNQVALIDFQS